MPRKRGKIPSQDIGHGGGGGGASRSHTKRSKRTTDNQHDHHRGGLPPWHVGSGAENDEGLQRIGPSAFPHEDEWDDAVFPDDDIDDDAKYTVRGLSGFVHVRCPDSAQADSCRCGRHARHVDSPIIAVDGACPHNGASRATQSSYGVFFGWEDEAEAYNISELVEDDEEYPIHTSQRAELHAAIAALKAVERFVKEGGQWPCPLGTCDDAGANGCKVGHIVIKSDSAYLVNSITQYIRKWVSNGWLTASRKPVANQDLWQSLLMKIEYLRFKGAGVDFWLVPREMNEEADELANDALVEARAEDSDSDDSYY